MGPSDSLAATNSGGARRENLPLVFQEVLTAIVRLRAGSQATTDPEKFRAQFLAALNAAEQEGAARGYPSEYVRLCMFAVVAFLDESVLNSQNAVFVDWPRRPLQEQLFGVHIAGEIFFRNLDRILSMPESEQLADVLEVHLLCILLGFRGKYRLGGYGDLRAITQSVNDRIRRIRGGGSGPPSGWAPPAEAAPVAADPWVKRFGLAAAVCCGSAIVLFVICKLLLSSGMSGIQSIAAGVRI